MSIWHYLQFGTYIDISILRFIKHIESNMLFKNKKDKSKVEVVNAKIRKHTLINNIRF